SDDISLRIWSYFSKKEIKLWYKHFLKDCPSGRLSKQEFETIYRQVFPSGDPGKFSGFVFNVFDADHSGTITFDEFIIALSVTSRGNLDEKLDWAFSLYDIDKDGKITKEEMTNIVKAIFDMVGNQLAENSESPESRVNLIFTLMDANHDGFVTNDEFVQGAKKDPWIVHALAMDLAGMPGS
ncbi:frequenin-1-like, partial [Watersipora subatra]|uniref:frequenin-1-like n=1 Tax=Watersipora subatra TaxID=2589382 RepID=UPI00355B094E